MTRMERSLWLIAMAMLLAAVCSSSPQAGGRVTKGYYKEFGVYGPNFKIPRGECKPEAEGVSLTVHAYGLTDTVRPQDEFWIIDFEAGPEVDIPLEKRDVYLLRLRPEAKRLEFESATPTDVIEERILPYAEAKEFLRKAVNAAAFQWFEKEVVPFAKDVYKRRMGK